jgi:gamma-glutamylcyclotransferase (GGCT)/AIG2-like uncharacterized protein YtfP
MERLFVYGTLRRVILMPIFWTTLAENGCRLCAGSVLRTRLGSGGGFSGIIVDNNGPRVDGYLFLSADLSAHWPMLDAFEEGYDRVAVDVTTEDGQRVTAWIYQLQPK